jgi:hypothetical protein
MTWLEILGWFLGISAVTNFCWFKGVRTGIKHSIMTLNLDEHQVKKLNKELEKGQSKLVLN